MILKHLSFHNFRSYQKAEFAFSPQTTIVVGPNAVGKSNLLEAIVFLATGKSYRIEKEQVLIRFGETSGSIKGVLTGKTDEEIALEVLFAQQANGFLQKKYLVNGVAKQRIVFAGKLTTVLFTPTDLDIVIGQPSDRRAFLNAILEQVDQEYSMAFTTYTKALRQRNALLEGVQKTGQRNRELFAYWDELVITNGQFITNKREAFISYINHQDKRFFPFSIIYDKSAISQERLVQYKDAEVGAGVTLVGPHRDDLEFQILHKIPPAPFSNGGERGIFTEKNVKNFASRGQQRLVVLELKLSQIAFMTQQTGRQPLLLLDDIFSELDSQHISQILTLTKDCQTVITTTHREFISDRGKSAAVIELGG